MNTFMSLSEKYTKIRSRKNKNIKYIIYHIYEYLFREMDMHESQFILLHKHDDKF